MSNAVFYHAGCPVCLGAEQMLINALDQNKYTLESVHLGTQPNRIDAAEAAGVISVPALVLEDQVFHINFGAALADLKA
ncbi:thioredoxin family protein [Methylomonas methanica]|uniref:Thioredoxin n=1 Tax=Methylomonas methanica (strain DSM 25384 / MC09) TaxID=857087 RepID=G0A1Y5_METMM|nr:thioredoxin family protein [Methylomonas methanica]AEG01368.1 thioredoxin [Methylomonas methanica MC09]